MKDLFERVECLAGGGIPKDVQSYIKMGILKAVFEQLTESYSKIKKVEKLLEGFNISDKRTRKRGYACRF